MKKRKVKKEKVFLGSCFGRYINVRGSNTHIHDPLFWDTLSPCPACFWYKETRRVEGERESLENMLPF
jgi:hypothetical protein